jgi:hypothetical protein
MSMNTDHAATLSIAAADIAMRSAATFIRQRGIVVDDYDALTTALRVHCRRALDVAMDDAKAAIECGMSEAAAATFQASFVRAGINAAKEYAATNGTDVDG